jgi:hypothetical protein
MASMAVCSFVGYKARGCGVFGAELAAHTRSKGGSLHSEDCVSR